MGNASAKCLEYRKNRINLPIYPFLEIKSHLKTDIESLAAAYNFVGKGICRSIPHDENKLKLDHLEKNENMTELQLPDDDQLFYPEAYPGDEITFVVYCEVSSPPQWATKKKKKGGQRYVKRGAQCEFWIIQYEVSSRGRFHAEMDNLGKPTDFNISYDRFIQSCGVQSLKEQRCRNTFYSSRVFATYFKGKKIRWKCSRMKANSGPLLSSHIKPEGREIETISFTKIPDDFECKKHEVFYVEGVIESQGGTVNNHCVSVTKIISKEQYLIDFQNVQPPQPQPYRSQHVQPPQPQFQSQVRPQFNPQSNAKYRPPAHHNYAPPPYAAPPPSYNSNHTYTNPQLNQSSHKAKPVGLSQIRDEPSAPDMLIEGQPEGQTGGEGVETPVAAECVVCLEEDSSYAFIPCGHRCVCESCAKNLYETTKECPLCRSKIQQTMKIFI